MSEVMRKTLVQAIDRLHVLLPDLTRLAAIPGRDSRRLDYWSRRSGAGAGSADQVIDFFLGQDFFHGGLLFAALRHRHQSKSVAGCCSPLAPLVVPGKRGGNCFADLKMRPGEVRYWDAAREGWRLGDADD